MRKGLHIAATALLAALAGCTDEEVRPMSPDDSQVAGVDSGRREKATFAAGCFWGVEATFRRVPGVTSTQVGYTGGHAEHPTYRQVCTGTTGHAEAVEVEFDPGRVSYGELLEVFWGCHDPTTPNRQGPDRGTQYRSAVFFHDAGQEAAAVASKRALGESGRHKAPVVTEIVAASTLWRAEEYHQRYLEKNGGAACHIGLR